MNNFKTNLSLAILILVSGGLCYAMQPRFRMQNEPREIVKLCESEPDFYISPMPKVTYLQRMYKISPLLGAVLEVKVDKVAQALAQGANPNVTNENGYTALHWIADKDEDIMSEKYMAIAVLLLEHGADPTIKATGGVRAGESAIDLAKRLKNTRLLRLFAQFEKKYSKL